MLFIYTYASFSETVFLHYFSVFFSVCIIYTNLCSSFLILFLKESSSKEKFYSSKDIQDRYINNRQNRLHNNFIIIGRRHLK